MTDDDSREERAEGHRHAEDSAAATAMPIAMTSTVRVNNSRECVRAMLVSRRGIRRPPAPSVRAVRAASFRVASAIATGMLPAPKMVGRITRTNTVTMSSTTSQPMAILPTWLCRSELSASTRVTTTVLATQRAIPNTAAAGRDHPNLLPARIPRAVTAAICTRAPVTAIPRTARKSLRRKWSPTPNIRRMTPTSANCSAMARFTMKPGVWGPMSSPAIR